MVIIISNNKKNKACKKQLTMKAELHLIVVVPHPTIILMLFVVFFLSEWEGGDEWVRAQFKEYILALLSSVHKGGKLSL